MIRDEHKLMLKHINAQVLLTFFLPNSIKKKNENTIFTRLPCMIYHLFTLDYSISKFQSKKLKKKIKKGKDVVTEE